MNKKYLDQLESDTIQLVLLIEKHTEKEINVDEVPMRTNLACEIENTTILTPEGIFPDSSVLHELLHIRRFIVDDVPQLAVCHDYFFDDPNFETRVSKLDNNLELIEVCRSRASRAGAVRRKISRARLLQTLS